MNCMVRQKCFLSDDFVLSMLMQLCSAVVCMQTYLPHGGMVHNDCYFRNILMDHVPEQTILAYHFPKTTFYCKTYGWLLKCADFGWATLLQWDENLHNKGLGKKRIRGSSYLNWEHILSYSNVDSIRRDLLTILINWLGFAKGGVTPRMYVFLQDFAQELQRLGCVDKEVIRFEEDGHKKRWMRSCSTPTVGNFVQFIENKFQPSSFASYGIVNLNQFHCPGATNPSTGNTSSISPFVLARLTKANKAFRKQCADYREAVCKPSTQPFEIHHYYPTDENPKRLQSLREFFYSSIQKQEQVSPNDSNEIRILTASDLSRPFL